MLLITGADGQLGRELVRQAPVSQFKFKAFNRRQLDITDDRQVEHTLSEDRPALVINAAAYTKVDNAESEKDLAGAVNHTGAENLARSCARTKTPLVHVSTDYVFDGRKGSPYCEQDPIEPLGIYGRTKADGEIAVRQTLKSHVILRTSWLYGVYGNNFVKTILRIGSQKEVVNVVADQFGSPTSASDLAGAILDIADQIRKDVNVRWGTYHYCGQGIISWFEFAQKILELGHKNGMNKISRVEPITTAEYPTAAERPAYSGLDCSLIQKAFDIQPKPWAESLEETIVRIFQEEEILREPT